MQGLDFCFGANYELVTGGSFAPANDWMCLCHLDTLSKPSSSVAAGAGGSARSTRVSWSDGSWPTT